MPWEELGSLISHMISQSNLAALVFLRSVDSHRRSDERSVEPISAAGALNGVRESYLHWGNLDNTNYTVLAGRVKGQCGCATVTPATLLMFLCLAHRNAGAQDPRDKVFGFLGIVNEIARKEGLGRCHIQPNYTTTTPEELYIQVAKDVLEETGSAAIFATFQDPPGRRKGSMPSWVPDLRIQLGVPRVMRLIAMGTFKAGGKVSPVAPSVRINGNCVLLRGHQVSQIRSLVALAPEFLDASLDPWVGRLAQLCRSGRVAKSSAVEDFWRTLLMNTVKALYPAKWPYKRIGDDWLCAKAGDHFRCYVAFMVYRGWRETVPEEADISGMDVYLRSLTDYHTLAGGGTGHMPDLRTFNSFIQSMVCRPDFAGSGSATAVEGHRLTVKRYFEFIHEVQATMADRSVVVSTRGQFANVPAWSQTGDHIVIVQGCPCPLILRPSKDDPSSFTLVGHAYVHGIMHGEAINATTRWEEYCLV
ncbi:hypothetical protein CLAIMM_06501 [Cladophialophora immunda]|nr:hypothetical protein CLAIMM_06501 [Cladophialophora immunda]